MTAIPYIPFTWLVWAVMGAGVLLAFSVGVWSANPLQQLSPRQVADVSYPDHEDVIWYPTRDQLETMSGPAVYIIRLGAPAAQSELRKQCKIGFTGNTPGRQGPGSVLKRINDYSEVMTFPPEYVAVIRGNKKLETALHRHFQRERFSRRREWFLLPEEDLTWPARVERVVREHNT